MSRVACAGCRQLLPVLDVEEGHTRHATCGPLFPKTTTRRKRT
ncbi:hypothetical protein [Pseudokineococcus marinus]|nr:hypothetical protein [Pseudokineococcus marinus]